MDREKVIKGLEQFKSDFKPFCGNTADWERVDDALTLLKEHEARILDWYELEDWENAVWFEDKDEYECYIALIANVGTYDAKFTNVEPGNIHSLDFMRDSYMKEWRCWSARPTIKQRNAVKWE